MDENYDALREEKKSYRDFVQLTEASEREEGAYQPDEPQALRPGDVFELMGQKYTVHRVASKNIVIRKLKTVKLDAADSD